MEGRPIILIKQIFTYNKAINKITGKYQNDVFNSLSLVTFYKTKI